MSWFKRESPGLETGGERKVKSEGLWVKCDQCRAVIWKKELEAQYNVCAKFDCHFKVDTKSRLCYLFDNGTYS